MKTVREHRDEVYEKCIRKAEQQLEMCNRAAEFGKARVLSTLILSLRSMRHAEHKEFDQPKETE